HDDDGGRTVVLQEKVLARNDALAQQNRDWLQARGVRAVNLMGSPGAGKTTLLERTATDLAGQLVISVIEGDQETALDAGRMRRGGRGAVHGGTRPRRAVPAGRVGAAPLRAGMPLGARGEGPVRLSPRV